MREQLGDYYDKTSDFQQDQFVTLSRVIRETVKVESVRTLLDIGCGSGARTVQAFDLFPLLQDVTAFDPDFEMIEKAIASYSRDGIVYRKASAEVIGELAGTEACWSRKGFNAAISNWAVHWIADKQAFFDGLGQLTASGSYFMFSTCERLPKILQDVDDYIKNEFRITAAPSPFHYLEKDEWAALLDKNGWDVVRADSGPLLHDVVSAETYLTHWFTASATKFMYGKHLAELPAISRSDLLFYMQRAYPSALHPQGLSFNEDVLFVTAVRR